MTRVSVVIPCLDMGEYLNEAVTSALAQTHQDLEVIVVDDGSTDAATVALVSSCPWPGVRVIRQKNRGLAAARNAGISVSDGEYILPLDADDIIGSTYVERAAAVLDAEPDTGIVYCRARLFGAREGGWELPEFSVPRMLFENLIFSCAMFRRASWAQIGGYAEDLRVREDHHFWLAVIAAGAGVHRIDDELFHYRIRPDSMNATAPREALVGAHARMLSDFHALFGAHASDVVAQAFAVLDELNDWRLRYGGLERFIARHQTSYGALRSVRRRLWSHDP